MLDLKTEFLFDAHFHVDPQPENWMNIGDGGWGNRVIFPVAAAGGTFEGPRMKGTLISSFGADWLTIRSDRVAWVDVRCVLKTHDNALIHMEYNGICDMSDDDINARLNPEAPRKGNVSSKIRVHTTPRFETGHANYQWLNKILTVGIGETGAANGERFLNYSIYALV